MTDLEIFGKLAISIDGLRDDLRSSRERETRIPPQPLERALTNAGNFPASGVMGLSIGGPQQGRVWRVRSIAVGGSTPTTPTAGRADVFAAESKEQILAGAPASGSQPGSGGVIFSSGLAAGATNKWRDQAVALPLVAFYGFGDLTVHAGEQLWVVFSGGTSTDLLIANVRVDDYETAAYALARQA